MTKETEAAIIAAIQNAPDEAWLAAMDAMDRHIARTDKWAFREFTGRWPTKADKAGASR